MININSWWIEAKIRLRLPFPLKQHFYKGRRYRMMNAIFCADCNQFFATTKLDGDKPLSELRCPHCGSKSWHFGPSIFEAWVDKTPSDKIHKIIERNRRLFTCLP